MRRPLRGVGPLGLYAAAVLALFLPEARAALFFSEVGGGDNLYLEIYNSGDAAVGLATYVLRGPRKWFRSAAPAAFPPGATVQARGVYVVCHPSAAPAVLSQCDHKLELDEGANYCLVASGQASVYDCVGDESGGAGRDVCGEGDAEDATLIRKYTVTAGALWLDSAAAGTCEWDRLPQGTFTYVGRVGAESSSCP
ncbi:hypothetical protein M885DRAFT_626708 [Pelagophyceae sp. CCMP2097]|nr:hypothetical protein M885DRAFT_626708 [Pelagophyceae sp. CCMP2097]